MKDERAEALQIYSQCNPDHFRPVTMDKMRDIVAVENPLLSEKQVAMLTMTLVGRAYAEMKQLPPQDVCFKSNEAFMHALKFLVQAHAQANAQDMLAEKTLPPKGNNGNNRMGGRGL